MCVGAAYVFVQCADFVYRVQQKHAPSSGVQRQSLSAAAAAAARL